MYLFFKKINHINRHTKKNKKLIIQSPVKSVNRTIFFPTIISTKWLMRLYTFKKSILIHNRLVISFAVIFDQKVTFFLLIFSRQWNRPILIQILQTPTILMLPLLVRNILSKLFHFGNKLWLWLIVIIF